MKRIGHDLEAYVEARVGLCTHQIKVSLAGRVLRRNVNGASIDPPLPLPDDCELSVYADGALIARFVERGGYASDPSLDVRGLDELRHYRTLEEHRRLYGLNLARSDKPITVITGLTA